MANIRIRQRSKPTSGTSRFFLVSLLVIVFASIFNIGRAALFVLSITQAFDESVYGDSRRVDQESVAMQLWRLELQNACRELLHSIGDANITSAHLKAKGILEAEALQRVKMSAPESVLGGHGYPE